jgi:hypothetical protein
MFGMLWDGNNSSSRLEGFHQILVPDSKAGMGERSPLATWRPAAMATIAGAPERHENWSNLSRRSRPEPRGTAHSTRVAVKRGHNRCIDRIGEHVSTHEGL